MKKKSNFVRFTQWITNGVGQVGSFLVALGFVIIWMVSGPFFKFSDTWQLIINTSTTIITFLMVFLIQHTQNRDMIILNLKLDELIKSHKSAKNDSIDLSKLSDESLDALEKEYKKICHKQTGQ